MKNERCPLDDAEIKRLLRLLMAKKRREVIDRLLSGNDSCCFTTQQYVDVWGKYIDRGRSNMMFPSLAEEHLRSAPGICEVSPGVWAQAWPTPMSEGP